MNTRPPALVLTAGLGTRLDPLTRVRCKPAVPVAGEPLARRIVKWLVASGITDITCNLHHLPQTLTGILGDGADLGARIRYSWEHPVVLGSAGGPRQALDIVGADTFFIVNGDTLTNAPLDSLERAHASRGAAVTMALVANHEPERYGGVQLDADGSVVGFVKRGEAASGSYHFIGVQLVSKSVFHTVPKGTVAATIGGVYDQLIRTQPGSVRGIVVDADFHDVGTVDDYRRTSARLASGQADIGARTRTAPSATIVDSILWDDVSVGDDVRLERCIVTDRVRVPDGAVCADAVLLNDEHGQLVAVSTRPTP